MTLALAADSQVGQEPGLLTKVDLAALRSANDSISFRHKSDTQPSRWDTGWGYLTARKRFGDGPYSATAEYDFTLPSKIVYYKLDGSDDDYSPCLLARYYLSSPLHYENRPWPTIASLLRVGDSLSLRWVRGTVLANDYRADELSLIVQRGKTRMVFLLASDACGPGQAGFVTTRTWG